METLKEKFETIRNAAALHVAGGVESFGAERSYILAALHSGYIREEDVAAHFGKEHARKIIEETSGASKEEGKAP